MLGNDTDGSLLGGVSVGGPKYRVDTPRLHRAIVDSLFDAVDSFERALSA